MKMEQAVKKTGSAGGMRVYVDPGCPTLFLSNSDSFLLLLLLSLPLDFQDRTASTRTFDAERGAAVSAYLF
jgi:hypothetical protein